MVKLAIVALGGALGAVARYGLGDLVHRHYPGRFPLGTMIINILGCLALGAIMSLVEDRQSLRPEARLFLGVGLCGAFTTFSTFGYETVQLLRDGSWGLATVNVAVSVVVGLFAVWGGRALVQAATA